MEWYSVKSQTDEKIIGAYPQTNGMTPEYDLKKKNSVWNIPNLKLPDFEPDFDSFNLDKKAKLTDVISTGLISACGLLLNDKTKQILSRFNLPKHIYYPATIWHKKEILKNYYWLQFAHDNTNEIVFESSQFELTHPLPFFREESITLRNKEYAIVMATKAANPDYELFPDKISLKNANNLDLLIFGFLYNNIYINNNLASALATANISGLTIKKIDPLTMA